MRQAGEIGYWCAPWARGRGVMSAAVRLVRDWAFDELELERLELTTDVDNIGSQRVAQAAGFRREGVMRGYLTARDPPHRRRAVRHDRRRPARAAGRRCPTRGSRTAGWSSGPSGRTTRRPSSAACDDPDVAHWIHLVPEPVHARATPRRSSPTAGGAWWPATARAWRSPTRATGQLLGSISLDLFRERQAAEIGYWVAARRAAGAWPWRRRAS